MLTDGKHLALVAPRQSGKTALLYELKRQGEKLPDADRPQLRIIRSLDFRDLTESQFLIEFAKKLSVPSRQVDESRLLPLAEAIRLLIRKSVVSDRKPSWILIPNIEKFSWPNARAILEALHACAEDPATQRLSAVVTGNQEFISLTYSDNSPYRHAEKALLQGFDRELTDRYFRARSLGLSLEASFDDYALSGQPALAASSLDSLYTTTGGYAHFIDEVRRTLTRVRDDHSPWSATWMPEPSLLESAANRFINEFMDFDVNCQLPLEDVQRDRDAWQLLQQMVTADGNLQTLSSGRPHLLETTGIVRRDANGTFHFASTIWQAYLAKRFTVRYLADVHAIAGEWNDAWRLYDRCIGTSICDRPLDGEDRHRLNRVLKSWEESLIDASNSDSDEVIARFERGVRYLYGCESCSLYDRKDGQLISSLPKHMAWNETTRDSITCNDEQGMKVQISVARSTLHCRPDTIFASSRVEFQPELCLKRPLSHPFDSSTIHRLSHSLKRFWQAFLAARRIEYDVTTGYMRDKHLQVVELINRLLASHAGDFKHVVDKTVEAIVEVAHYYRALVCLVSADGSRIQSVASRCADPTNDFEKRTDFRLLPNSDAKQWDIQQWVAIRGQVCSIEDAAAPSPGPPVTSIEQATCLGMRAICVLPLIVPRESDSKGEVLGTLHLEREDRRPLTNDEIKACEILASQIAVAFDLARRLSMLQSSLSELEDDFEILSPDGRRIFVNHGTGHRGSQSRTPHWKFPITQIGRGLSPTWTNARVVEDAANRGKGVHRYVRDDRRRLPRAYDDFAAPIHDFRADLPGFPRECGKVGYVRLTHDISDLVQMNEAFHKWLTASDTRKTASRILRYLRRSHFHWCRIYLLKDDRAAGTRLESFAEFGIKDLRVAEDFRNGLFSSAWDCPEQQASLLINELRGLALLTYDPNMIGPPRRDDQIGRGIPSFVTNDSWREEFGKVDRSWLEAPLLVGSRCIGLIALSLPSLAPSEEIMSPQSFEKLQRCVIDIAVALHTSLQAEESVRRKLDVASRTASYMATHQLANKLAPAQSAINYAIQQLEVAPGDVDGIMANLLMAYEEVDNCRTVVRKFLDYASSGPLPGVVTSDIGGVVASVTKSIRKVHPTARVYLFKEHPLVMAKVSPAAIVEVFEILTNNAVQHSGLPVSELRIDVSVSLENGIRPYVEIEFRNNGRTLSDSARIFEPFVTTHAQGNGLGLAVARKLLERQNGSIVAKSDCTSGAAFVIRFPAVMSS